jgi:beta-lactamase regulating signal transducer with metallopeptidase domain
MIAELLSLLVRTLIRAEAAASLCIVLVLVLRAPGRRLLGAGLAYRLWTLPLAAAAASLFPTLAEFRRGASALDAPGDPALDARLVAVWVGGALLFALVLAAAEIRFRRRVKAGVAGPAVTGIGWRRLVTPKDFHARFDAGERALILRHERMHMDRRDPEANLLTAVLQALSWFNPLAHLAAAAARLDQELACDEAVVRDRPDLRRGYGETLLKAQLSGPASPFACAFFSRAAVLGARHPLEVRLAMLARPQPGLGRYLSGLAAVGAMALLIAAAVWAGAPERPAGAALGYEAPGSDIVTITAFSPSG